MSYHVAMSLVLAVGTVPDRTPLFLVAGWLVLLIACAPTDEPSRPASEQVSDDRQAVERMLGVPVLETRQIQPSELRAAACAMWRQLGTAEFAVAAYCEPSNPGPNYHDIDLLRSAACSWWRTLGTAQGDVEAWRRQSLRFSTHHIARYCNDYRVLWSKDFGSDMAWRCAMWRGSGDPLAEWWACVLP